jgi:hypothetical protein
MIKVCRGTLAAAVLVGLGLVVPTNQLAAQLNEPESVTITTVDGVQLHGSFYQSAKAKAPTVILLHKIGDSAVNKKLYTGLAEALQPNYSVMVFDFRGHGKSKDITPADFWKVGVNNAKNIKGAGPKKNTIEYADFNKSYYPVLVNDISAVKAYLDRRNDQGDCNTSNTIIIGAETGATLGAIWLNSQWSLTRMLTNPNNPLLPPAPNKDPEGKDVIACIWLSMATKLASGDHQAISISKTLETAVKGNATPTVFIYGDKDTTGKDIAKNTVKSLKAEGKQYEFIVPYEVKGNTKLQGMDLCQKGLGTEKVIADYLVDVLEAKRREWGKRDFKTSEYRWRAGGGLAGPAKLTGPLGSDPNNLMFDDYLRFIGH